jgi:DNA sulfur modification protein DndD
MSLRFDSVSLKNFGPYRSIEDLILATDSDSPIVVIHGENTLGKTSLFRALRWCLYGSPEAGKTSGESARHLVEYMNRPARAEGETDMQVGMTFTANGSKYNLVRKATFDTNGAARITTDLRIDSQVVQQAAIDSEIGRILHPQISEFFLFDGELLRDFYDRLNTDRERDLLRTSIEHVLGIPALQLAEHDISVLTDDVLQRQTKALKTQNDADGARRQMLVLKSEQESLDKDRQDVEGSLRKARSDLEEVKERIAAVEDLKADAREMEGLEAQIAGGKQEEAQLQEDMRRILTRGWLAPVAARLTKELQRVREQNDAAQARQQAIIGARERVNVLQKQIEGGECPTCHQPLPAANEETHEHLAAAEHDLHALAGTTSDGPDLLLERKISALIDTSAAPAYQDRQNQLNKVLASQFERERRLSGIKVRMKDNDVAKIRQLGESQDRLESAIDRYEADLKGFKPKQDDINTRQSKVAGILRRLSGSQPSLAAEAYFFEYARTLFTKTIERYQERTRAEVERSASEMLVKLIRDSQGYEGLRIGSDYSVDLVGSHGAGMKTSEGGKQLVALSLIGALKQAAVRGGPVVLDSPLARLDLEHRANVLQTWVPALGNQAILLVQSGELTEAEAQKIMGNRIGHEYRIFRPNEDPEEASIERTA